MGIFRWVYLDGKKNSDGSIDRRWFDNMLMTLNGDQVSVWMLTELELDNTIMEKTRLKWVFDLSTQKIRIERGSFWSKEEGWHIKNKPSPHSEWQSIIPGSEGEHWMETIKKYVDEHRAEIIENMHEK